MSGPALVLDAQIARFFTDSFVDADVLTSNERAIIANTVLKRQRDFSTGRYCAKKALEEFGLANVEILRGAGKEPLWPEGFVGSISHAAGLCGAVAGSVDYIKAIGLDIEKIGGVKKEMWDMICTPNEQELLNTVFADEQDLYATLLFSVKESFYKLQYPITQTFLEFTDVEAEWDGQNFSLSVIKSDYNNPIDFSGLKILWTVYERQIVSLCYLPKS